VSIKDVPVGRRKGCQLQARKEGNSSNTDAQSCEQLKDFENYGVSARPGERRLRQFGHFVNKEKKVRFRNFVQTSFIDTEQPLVMKMLHQVCFAFVFNSFKQYMLFVLVRFFLLFV